MEVHAVQPPICSMALTTVPAGAGAGDAGGAAGAGVLVAAPPFEAEPLLAAALPELDPGAAPGAALAEVDEAAEGLALVVPPVTDEPEPRPPQAVIVASIRAAIDIKTKRRNNLKTP